MDAIEVFPGAELWTKFNDACLQAEARMQHAELAAAEERDQLIKSLPGWTMPVSDRVERAANARYEKKVKKARDQCEDDCARAQEELIRHLAVLEIRGNRTD